MLDRMDEKLGAYLRLTTSTAHYLPSNAPEIRGLMREAMEIRQSVADHSYAPQARLMRFDRIGIELLAWATTMALLDKAKIPLG